jgi:adenylate cyclase
MDLDAINSPVEINLLISFFSLNSYSKLCQTKDSKEIFSILSDFFELTGAIIESNNGKIIKWTGDGALAVFQEDNIRNGIAALLECREKANERFAQRGLPLEMVIKANFGRVTCGRLGTKSSEQLDVIGAAVNTAARLSSSGLTITSAVFEKLDGKAKELFKEYASGWYALFETNSRPAT